MSFSFSFVWDNWDDFHVHSPHMPIGPNLQALLEDRDVSANCLVNCHTKVGHQALPSHLHQIQASWTLAAFEKASRRTSEMEDLHLTVDENARGREVREQDPVSVARDIAVPSGPASQVG